VRNRRKLLVALGASALTGPFALFAQQQGKVWRIGLLSESTSTEAITAFKAGLYQLGYAEGRDYVIERRSADNVAALPALAAQLIAMKVDVIVPGGSPSALAARNATREIPILIVTVGDPVGIGLAESLRHPGGNVTGLSGMTTELSTKRLDLLRQMLPGMRRVGFLYNPDNGNDMQLLKHFESDCTKLQFISLSAPARKREDIAPAFNALIRDQAQALIVSQASTNLNLRQSIVEQAAKHRLPAIYGRSSYVDSGGLISYATDGPDLYRRVAAYADKIFKGAKPGDIPIEQPTKFEMVINLKTANALGIKLPQLILVRADRVIE